MTWSMAPDTMVPTSNVVKAIVDTGQGLESTPGEGIGVFIEYQTGGRWHVHTSCDTNLSGHSCAFSVWATVPATSDYGNISTEQLEDRDAVIEYAEGPVFETQTDDDSDGFFFDATAGTAVRFEVYLDGVAEPRYVYWAGGGAVHEGAPTHPIELQPSSP